MSYKKIKRILDIVLSLLLLILFLPLLLVVSFCIWITDMNNIFVKEPVRLGIKGKQFRMYKFRSMIPQAHKVIKDSDKYEDWVRNDGKLRIKEDPRITWVGKIIRKTDIDELPQLLNVLIGDMSLVGPRPMYQEEINRYLGRYSEGKRYLKRIFKVKPGITGIWQVSGRNDIKFKDRIVLEAKYASHISFFEDTKIFLKTPFVVLTRKGVYE